MLKLFKSLCPVYCQNSTDPCGGQHRFAFKGMFPDGKTGVCTGCGVAARDLDTVWDKIEDLYHTVIPYRFRPKNLWYTFSCWAWKRYTTTKPRTLSHEWCDRNALLIHTVFEIARTFLEKEGPKNEQKWAWQKEHNPEFYASWLETKEIVDWWLNEYEESYVWGLSDEKFDKEYAWDKPTVGTVSEEKYSGMRAKARFEAEERDEQELRNKAKRIIDLSPYYWT